MVDSIRDNFKNHYGNNLLCPLDNTHYDDQPSLLTCPVISQDKELNPLIQKINYSDIFKSIEYQIPAIQVLEKIINFRKKELIKMNLN